MEWFFTAPIDDVAVRRGDPLGMRAVAEDMAEVLAPGLSNRTMDGRWLSIMCWALQQSFEACRVLGAVEDDGRISTRNAANELYSWLRPLEILWVARTVAQTDDRGQGRQLPGVRAVRHWIDNTCKSDRFGFASDSYSRYRFTGVYGAYRVALRSLPGLTVAGDGWRVGPLGRQFSDVVHGEVRCKRTHKLGKGKRPTPESYWQKGFEWRRGQTQFLPTVLSRPTRLGSPERGLLERALFSATEGTDVDRRHGARRRAVVEAAKRSSATTRPGLFADIARSLGGGKPLEEIAMLSPFCELADAGVAAMNVCWAAVCNGDGGGFARASDVLDRDEVIDALDVLANAVKRWISESAKSSRVIPVADALAASVINAKGNRKRQFQALERHHNQYGGGLKWLALDGDVIKPLAPIRGGDASEYRFRIGALCRLGVQAGIIGKMPAALHDSHELEEDNDEEEAT